MAAEGPVSIRARGYYSVTVDSKLRVAVMEEEDCGGASNMGSLVICRLTATLDCAPSSQFPHHYQLTADGLTIDSQRVAWNASVASSTVELLHALQGRMAADRNLARAQFAAGDPVARASTLDVNSPMSVRRRISGKDIEQAA